MKASITSLGHRFMTTFLLAVAAGTAAAPPDKPPPEVEVVTASAGTVALERELVGRLASSRVAEVRARVSGIVLERTYKEGSDVAAGAVLFRIDPAPLEAAVNAAEAALARTRADAENATLIARRQQDLLARKLAAQQDVDSALAAQRSTAAAVREAEAELRQAGLDLGYATVTAPIAGRAGRALVTEGALTDDEDTTHLTTVEQLDPIYLNFGQTVGDFQRLRAEAASDAPPPVTVMLPDGTDYPHNGRLDFSDVNVDAGTGMVLLRATVPNPERALLPGMYVNLRYRVGELAHAFVLPHAAVLRDSGGAYVMVVGADGKVARRAVTVRDMRDTVWVVTGELGDGERVIVAGLQQVRPGAPVNAVERGAGTGAAGAS
jgi:membrane fusion protein (multidrug efflux system)